jgi:hypothetical protein
MDNKIRIRFTNEMWWDEVPYTTALEWGHIEVTYLGDDTCFVNIGGQALEMHRGDYDRIKNDKAFDFKFNLDKHKFKFN